MKSNIQKIKELLSTPSKIVITTHTNPDGDAIGSSLAMYHFLKQLQHEVYVVIPNMAPDFLMWMSGSKEIVFVDKYEKKSRRLIKEADLVFSLDYNALHRVERIEEALKQTEATKILIDHHPNPIEEDFDILFSKTKTSSTAELVHDFIIDLDQKQLINKDISECIFSGLVTDTGSFSYACNYPETFRAVANLVEAGLDIEYVNRKIYSNNRLERLRLLGYSLSEKLVVIDNLHTAYISITKEEMERFSFKPGDTEGLVNYALSVQNVNLAVLLTERDNIIRLSFRSKGTVDVNQVARMHFNGGGHMKAAGGNSSLDMQQTLEKLVSILGEYKSDLIKDV